MSLFTALVPAPAALDHLAAAVVPVRRGWPHLRWVAPERWHVTVVFLGEVADDVVPALVDRTRDAVAAVPAPALRLAGAGEFPGGRAPLRVLWVGVRGEVAPLVAASEEAARACDVPSERREHVPHLTLARAGRGRAAAAPGRPGEVLSSYAGPVCVVQTLHLLRSRPGRPGPYEVVAALPLGRPGGPDRGTQVTGA